MFVDLTYVQRAFCLLYSRFLVAEVLVAFYVLLLCLPKATREVKIVLSRLLTGCGRWYLTKNIAATTIPSLS